MVSYIYVNVRCICFKICKGLNGIFDSFSNNLNTVGQPPFSFHKRKIHNLFLIKAKVNDIQANSSFIKVFPFLHILYTDA